ncbi:unnamed protein product [Camellia sinensis]
MHSKPCFYSVVGTDSHTTMIDGLGVASWGVGGIEVEATMLGQIMVLPGVVGFKLSGKLCNSVTSTDLVLTVTQMLRKHGVVGKFVEFYGEGVVKISLADRATIANVSQVWCNNGVLSHRSCYFAISKIDWKSLSKKEHTHLDLADVEPCISGPKRALLYQKRYRTNVVIAAIMSCTNTPSCTNTSNPSVMLGAGLVAKKACELGLQVKSWIKTSLAPGSGVTKYLLQSGLQKYLNEQGFHIVGYDCTTCIGNSGDLDESVASAISENDIVAAAVLSGNRNFEGRVHPLTRANYLASPPFVVAYALAGTCARMKVMGRTGNASVSSSKPNVVNIGALYTFNFVIGRSAKPGIEAAVDDVNSDSTVLAGMKLSLILHDMNCSGFLGTVEAHRHPTLSALQFPYFLCTRHSDYFQMYAIADLIKFYGWREVVTIFVNDDYGRNGIFVLGDALAKKRANISYKIVLTLGASRSDINDLLVRVNMMESRVYVFHVNPDSDLTIFSVAKLLWMLTADYIWIATDWPPFAQNSRMKTLKNQEEYVDTLHKGPKAGGVATIVDSFLTLSSYCTRPTANLDLWDKNLLKTDGDLDSPLVVDLSTAILRLLENGDLQRIHDRWILLNRCFAQANQVDENILYTPKDKEQDIDEHESIRPKSTLHVTSFKDFVDKKEDEVMESIEQKSDSKRQASQCSDGHPSSPSR